MGRKFRMASFAPVADAAAFAASEEAARLALYPGREVAIGNYAADDVPALSLPGRRRTFERLAYDAPALDLFSLPRATFHGWPKFHTQDGLIVSQSVRHWAVGDEPDPAPMLRQVARLSQAPTRRLAGAHVLGMSEFAYNFYHWHVDILPAVMFMTRLGLMDEAKVVIHGPTGFLVESLKHLGVPLERIVGLSQDAPTEVERLVWCSTHDNHGGEKHPEAMRVFAAIKAGAPGIFEARPGRRVFASRGGSTRRALLNRPAVEAAFAAAGFEVIDPSTLPYLDQIRLFHDAELVVGEHGANLAAIGFCQPGARVVELMHPTEGDLAYLTVAESLALGHRILVGEAQGGDSWTIDPSQAVAVASAISPAR